jgi:hypothetical protein
MGPASHTGGSASITVGSPSGMRGPSFAAPHFRIMNADTEHHPYGQTVSGGSAADALVAEAAAEAAADYAEDMAQSAGRVGTFFT